MTTYHYSYNMIKYLIVILATTLIATVTTAPVSAENLCAQDELKLFECGFEHSKKSVSICQSSIDRKNIMYKFGTQNNVEITLPNAKSGPPHIHFEHFGPASTQWVKQVIFPYGKIQYTLNTPQGISAILLVDGIKNPVAMTCETGDSGGEISDLYDLMEELTFNKK